MGNARKPATVRIAEATEHPEVSFPQKKKNCQAELPAAGYSTIAPKPVASLL
jgi:hypothetical protein